RTVTASLNALGAGDAQLVVSLAGATEGNHAVQVVVNDNPAGEARWSGREPFVLTTTVSSLRTGDNAISLRALGEPGQAEVDFLDWISLRYPRPFVAASDVLDVVAGAPNIRMTGFQAEPVRIYDISDPARPQALSGVTLARDNGAVSVAFTHPLPNRRYLAFAPDAARKPDQVRAARANTLRSVDQRADELIIAPAPFVDALQPLVKYRSERGLSVSLVDVDKVYDAFGDGVAQPQAIRDFITYTRTHWQAPVPRYVLLVGKASYDYHDYLNAPNKNLLPTYLVPTPHLGEAASDNWFVAQSEVDAHPALAIGRIPAKTPAQLSAAVDKLIAYERAPRGQDWQRLATFVADDKEATFNESADRLSAQLPAGIRAQKVYLSDAGGDVNTARPRIIQQWNTGVSLLTYI